MYARFKKQQPAGKGKKELTTIKRKKVGIPMPYLSPLS
jgi:hypothetical protein